MTEVVDGAPAVALADVDAERAVLGAVLLGGNRVVEEISTLVHSGEVFAQPRHEAVWDAAVTLHGQGVAVDAVSVSDAMHTAGTLRLINGSGYLLDLQQSCTTPASASWYARIVRDRWARRTASSELLSAAQACTQPADDPADVVDAARARLDAVSERLANHSEVDMSDAWDDAIDAIQSGAQCYPTPWPNLNDLIGGWRPGCLYVWAARPGEGKSIAGLNAARYDAQHNRTSVYVSLEMSRQEVITRLISDVGGVDLGDLVKGGSALREQSWQRIAGARERIVDLPLTILDSPAQTIADIRAGAREASRGLPLGLIVVDYLQLLGSVGKQESRQVEVAGLSRGLKLLGRTLGAPVLMLAQLNRGPEQRADRLPRLADLRESGAIEQDADVVILGARDPGNADAYLGSVAKNRHGPTGKLEFYWQGRYSRISTIARREGL